jgi:hypothetical protein
VFILENLITSTSFRSQILGVPSNHIGVPMSFISKIKIPIGWLLWAVGFLTSFWALWIKCPGLRPIGNFLWGEDSSVFYLDAHLHGLRSLWIPYAGYLEIHQRLWAWLASLFDLVYLPYFYSTGWLLAYGVLCFMIISRGILLGLNPWWACLLSFLITLQPATGEVFFNLTNSQWFLGAALMIFLFATPDSRLKPTVPICLFTFILSLTGPYSIFVAPFMILRTLISKNRRQSLILTTLVLLCAGIQIFTLIHTGRTGPGVSGVQYGNLYKPLRSLFYFGTHDEWVIAVATLFWGTFMYTILFPFKSTSLENTARRTAVLFLAGVVSFKVGMTLYAFGNNPMLIGALQNGERYRWIPYSLSFFIAAIASIGFKKARILVWGSLGVLCGLQFHTFQYQELNFHSFARFAAYQAVSIPTSPALASYPGWHIDSSDRPHIPPPASFCTQLMAELWESNGTIHPASTAGFLLFSPTVPPTITLRTSLLFKNSTDIAVEVEMSLKENGLVQLDWGPSKDFKTSSSMRRIYPAGNITAQYAFPNPPKGFFLRFQPLEHPGEILIKSIRIYALP